LENLLIGVEQLADAKPTTKEWLTDYEPSGNRQNEAGRTGKTNAGPLNYQYP
jgi:hypothetical protein